MSCCVCHRFINAQRKHKRRATSTKTLGPQSRNNYSETRPIHITNEKLVVLLAAKSWLAAALRRGVQLLVGRRCGHSPPSVTRETARSALSKYIFSFDFNFHFDNYSTTCYHLHAERIMNYSLSLPKNHCLLLRP